jgi:hypothetical protein
MLQWHRVPRLTRGALTALGLLLLVASCRAVSPDSSATQTSLVDARGSWRKLDDRLPPIALDITESGTTMHARLRLSGVQRDGELVGTPQQLVLRFPAGAEVLTIPVTLVSLTEMRLQLTPGGETYTLRKVE